MFMHEAVPDIKLVVASFSCRQCVACCPYMHMEQYLMLHCLLLHSVGERV